jgi:hypothetical protein
MTASIAEFAVGEASGYSLGMELPKFWNDSGSWNESLVKACITLSICFWMAAAYFADAPWLFFASVVLGPITGFVVGFAAVSVLSTYFAKDPKRKKLS